MDVPSFVNHCLSLKGAQDWVLQRSDLQGRMVRRMKTILQKKGRGGQSAPGRGTKRLQLLKM